MASNTGKRGTLEPAKAVRQRNPDADGGGQPACLGGRKRQIRQHRITQNAKEKGGGRKDTGVVSVSGDSPA